MQTFDVIEALAKLGFSMWQVFWLGLLILFRNELRSLVARVSVIKTGEHEVHLSSVAASARELKEVERAIRISGTHGQNDSAIHVVEDRLNGIATRALERIRDNTKHLWAALQQLDAEKKSINCAIRDSTFESVHEFLQILQAGEYLSYTTAITDTGRDRANRILALRVTNISPELRELITRVAST